MTSVLDGIRVLDLSWGIAGPVAGMLLSDNGADVIKVEPPGGDPFRATPGYAAWLRGRRSAELDLTDENDRDHLFGPGPLGGRGPGELLSGYDRPSRHRRRHPAGREPTPDLLLDHRLWITSGPPNPSRLRRTGRGATRAAARTARPPGGSRGLHERRGTLPGGPRHPRGDGAGLTALGTHLHLHTLAEHVRRLPGHGWHQCRPPGAVAYRSGSARGDLSAPSRACR